MLAQTSRFTAPTQGDLVPEFEFKVDIDDDAYFQGLSRQEMDFHQSLGELVDNAMSARPPKAYGEGLETLLVEISIQELPDNNYRIIVADHGVGITQDDLMNRAFNPGGQGSSKGSLNEHGFGLKNALALLTSGNSTNFTLMTRTVSDDGFLLVEGPWGRNMQLTTEVTRERWSEGLHKLVDAETGTRVEVVVPKRYFRTIYRRGNPSFETFVTRLGEHFGVMFRGFIGQGNEIVLSYRSLNGDWTHRTVPEIDVPFEGDVQLRSKTITIDGEPHDFKFRRGVLDYSVKDSDAEDEMGWPYPLRIYYQGSNARCGIDLVVRDRVIKTGVFEEIWPDIAKTVDFNRFVGELRVGADFRTTNNKTGVDPHSPLWEAVLEAVRDDSDFRPEKATRSESEESLRTKLITILDGTFTNASVVKDRSVWGGAIDIDIYVDDGPGNRRIYELKVTAGRVIDLYQLLAGWDGMVKENIAPTVGILVCKEANEKLRNAVEAANARRDADENEYNIEVKEISELLPDST